MPLVDNIYTGLSPGSIRLPEFRARHVRHHHYRSDIVQRSTRRAKEPFKTYLLSFLWKYVSVCA